MEVQSLLGPGADPGLPRGGGITGFSLLDQASLASGLWQASWAEGWGWGLVSINQSSGQTSSLKLDSDLVPLAFTSRCPGLQV